MITNLKILLVIFGLLAITPLFSRVHANEGEFFLVNTVNENTRCKADTALMPNLDYQILMKCRDIIYPAGPDIFYYVAWARPANGDNPVRLGELGVGKALFKTNKQFNSIFVTRERTQTPRNPEGVTVMQGGLQTEEFLDQKPRPAIVSAPENELGDPLVSPTPTAEPDGNSGGISRVLAAGGVFAIIGLFVLFLFLFVVTRK